MKQSLLRWLLYNLFHSRYPRRWSRGLSFAILSVFGGCLLWNNNIIPHDIFNGLSLEKATTFAKASVSAGDTFEYSPGFPSRKTTDDASKILRRKGYAASYNATTLQPDWVAWRLTAGHCEGSAKRDGKEFTEDLSVPSPRADTYDYSRSGFDRGHMCPAADNRWSHEAMEQSFLMTNICPQNQELNRGDWNEIEQQCRLWAKEYGKIYIVCGPIFLRRHHKRIGKHRVPVPDAFFKVVLRLSPKPRGIGFICRNTDGSHPKDFYVNSIHEVERVTGYTFFPKMDSETAAIAKSSNSLKDWRFTPTRYYSNSKSE